MNFLKAAFFNEDGSSSLKNSEDLDNPDQDVTDGWDNQAEEWSPVNEEIDIDGPPEQGKDPSGSGGENSGARTGFWSLGGIVKSLTSKSEEVLESYRRDLEEFRSGLQKETEAIREVASRAVKDLPNSLDVGASVAQESLESVGQAIDEFGSSVWRGTSDILAEGDVFVVVAPPGNDEHVAYFLMRCTQIKSRLVRPYVDGEFTYQVGDLVVMGHFFERVKRQGDSIIYRDFMPEYISCQYNHLVVAAGIHLVEMKVKRGEPKRWKMSIADHDRIMETCIPITHWPDE